MTGATPVAAASPVLLDEFIESYVTWRESCGAVSAAYKRWASCEPAHRSAAFESYRAALDREELAAQVHADRVALCRVEA
jgi:hypothetical protein